MENYISILPSVTLLVTLAATFAVLFAIMLKIFRGVAFFEGKTAVIMALCVCIIGLSQFIVVPGRVYNAPEAKSEISVSGLPYFALAVAVAVILSQVLLLAGRIPPSEEPEPLAKKSEQVVVEPKSPGRPKKPVEKPSKETSKPVGSDS